MQVKIVHIGNTDLQKEKIINLVCQKVTCKLKLPKSVVIILKDLSPCIYAETNLHSKDRIVINNKLSIKETIEPLIHELIHLSQIYTGQLVGKKHFYLWNGLEYKVKNGLSQDFKDYQTMPWELDVSQKLPKLLEYVLSTK